GCEARAGAEIRGTRSACSLARRALLRRPRSLGGEGACARLGVRLEGARSVRVRLRGEGARARGERRPVLRRRRRRGGGRARVSRGGGRARVSCRVAARTG